MIVDEPEEILNRLQLAFDELYGTFDIVECSHPALEDFDIRLLNPLLAIIFGDLYRTLGLDQLVLNGLTVNGSEVMFASAVDIEQIDEVLPALIQALDVVGSLFGAREFLVV